MSESTADVVEKACEEGDTPVAVERTEAEKEVTQEAQEETTEKEETAEQEEQKEEKEEKEEEKEEKEESTGAEEKEESAEEEKAESDTATPSESKDSDGEAKGAEDGGLPFVDVTRPNSGRIPLSSVALEEFYTTPDRSAIAGAVQGLNHFPLKSSGTVPLPVPFASAVVSPVNVPMMSVGPQQPMDTGVYGNTAPDDPPGPQEYIGEAGMPNKGYRLFSDVFSRADKNDDGGLTFEEFRSYFDDGHVTDEELLGLFNDVDADNNGNISLLELDSYFRRGFEPYSRMFSVLAKMHSAISGGMGHSYREYPQQSPFEQFKTRFYLREFVSQMHALHAPVASALEILEHATEVRRPSIGDEHSTPERPIQGSQRIAPRKARDAPLEEYSLADAPGADHSTDLASDVLAQLQAQVAKLSSAVEEIHGSRVNLKWVQHDVFDEHAPTESSYIVACRQADVTPELVYIFRDAARAYIAATQAEEGCLHVYIKQHANETKYAIYEIFASEDALCEHNTSLHFRHFQKQIIDSLEEPLASNLMELPTSWWGTDA